MVKINRSYVGGVLDNVGCFFIHEIRGHEYEYYKINAYRKEQIKMIDKIMPILKKDGVNFKIYKLKKIMQYEIMDKKSIKNLRKFIKKYCVIKR